MRDVLGGFVFLVLGGLVLAFGWDLPLGTARVPGPGVMPLFSGTLIVLLAAALIVQGFVKRAAAGSPDAQAEPVDWAGIGRVALVIAVVVAAVLLLPLIGFLACSTLLMATLAVIGAAPGGRLKALVFGVLVAASAYLLFVYALQVPMPAGSLWSM